MNVVSKAILVLVSNNLIIYIPLFEVDELFYSIGISVFHMIN